MSTYSATYPDFDTKECEWLFVHWWKNSGLCDNLNCAICKHLHRIMATSTALMIHTILRSYSRMFRGSDITSLGVPFLSLNTARNVFYNKTLTESHCILSHLSSFLTNSFDNLVMENVLKLVENIDINLSYFSTLNNNTPIKVLSDLYKNCINLFCSSSKTDNFNAKNNCPIYIRTAFVLICMHLNGMYHMTADVVWKFWTEVIGINLITTLNLLKVKQII